MQSQNNQQLQKDVTVIVGSPFVYDAILKTSAEDSWIPITMENYLAKIMA